MNNRSPLRRIQRPAGLASAQEAAARQKELADAAWAAAEAKAQDEAERRELLRKAAEEKKKAEEAAAMKADLKRLTEIIKQLGKDDLVSRKTEIVELNEDWKDLF